MDEQLKQKIDGLVQSHKLFLFMKGTPEQPMCGYSARVVEALRQVGVKEYGSCNVLEDHPLWEGVKEYSNWPTMPQLYVNGKLIGGCDITLELAASGELAKILGTST